MNKHVGTRIKTLHELHLLPQRELARKDDTAQLSFLCEENAYKLSIRLELLYYNQLKSYNNVFEQQNFTNGCKRVFSPTGFS